MVFPSLFPTIPPTLFPTAVEPVTDIRGIRLSAIKLSPIIDDFATTRLNTPSGTLFFAKTELIIF